MKIPFNDLRRIHDPLREEFDAAWRRIVVNNAFILGREVEQFEGDFARYCKLPGKEYAAGVSNGEDALELMLRALGIGKGGEVITAANTFNATVSAIQIVGATPVLVDVNPDTYLMNMEEVKNKITSRTMAIIPVHLYGQRTPLEGICAFTEERGIYVLEDACQAHGSLRYGSPLGQSDAAAFSFYPGKNLGAFGDAGIVISRNDKLIERIKHLRNYGQSKKYHHDELGLNKRMDSLQAAILSVKLPHLDAWNECRRKSAEKLTKQLEGVGDLSLPVTLEGNTHSFHLYVVRTEKRDELQAYLSTRGIETGIHYPCPIHLQKSFASLELPRESFPIAERNAQMILSLPLFPFMKEEEIAYLAESVQGFFK